MKTYIELSKDVVVSDPCYPIKDGGPILIENMKPGKYKVSVDKGTLKFWGNRVSRLEVIHHRYSGPLSWEKHPEGVAVDSGQAGVFDRYTYRNDHHRIPQIVGKDNGLTGEVWYDHMCDRSLSEDQWGTYDRGVVSSSGVGDGSYDLNIIKNDKGQIVGIEIIFLEEDEEENNDDMDPAGGYGLHSHV